MFDVFRNPNDYWRTHPDECDEIDRLTKKALWAFIIIGVLTIVMMLFCGCKTKKPLVSEHSDKSDSVRIEYKEKIVKVPVTVYVEVPVEVKERFSNDSTSHLETSFAVSDASMVWIDGVAFLRHTLANKAQAIGTKDSGPVVEKEKVVWKTRRVTYTKTEIREKENTWWEKVKILFGGWSLLLNGIAIALTIWKRKSIFANF